MPTIRNVVKGIFGKRSPWFDRYTENARRTIFFGRWEALQVDSIEIEPKHIALGLFRDAWFTKEVLKGVSVDELRKQIIASLPIPQDEPETVDLPLSAESKRVLAHAGAEADALLDQHIGNEHLMLGLLRERSTRNWLRGTGLELENIRFRVKQIPHETRQKEGGEQAARWREAGIPDGFSVSQLLYNPAAETLILELKILDRDPQPRRLLFRHRTVERYQQIGNPSDDFSYESPVTCETHPLVVFNCKLLHKSSAGDYRSADWECLYMFNLANKDLSVCVSKDNFVVPAPYDERGWVSDVLSLSDDGSCAYIIVGVGKRQDTGAEGIHFHYYVARLNLSSKELQLISHLKNIWF